VAIGISAKAEPEGRNVLKNKGRTVGCALYF
jgi:hypothetical protein